MRLADTELELFKAACADPGNARGQELLNLFGVSGALQILDQMPTVPLDVLTDVISHVWEAVNHEARRRDGRDCVRCLQDHERMPSIRPRRIRTARITLGLTLESLAGVLGLTPRELWEIEEGNRSLPAPERLATALELLGASRSHGPESEAQV